MMLIPIRSSNLNEQGGEFFWQEYNFNFFVEHVYLTNQNLRKLRIDLFKFKTNRKILNENIDYYNCQAVALFNISGIKTGFNTFKLLGVTHVFQVSHFLGIILISASPSCKSDNFLHMYIFSALYRLLWSCLTLICLHFKLLISFFFFFFLTFF